MPAVHLTDITLRSLKLPEKGQVTYWDKSLKGFGLRCSQGGTRSYVVMHGAERRLTTIGRCGILKLAEARAEAKTILAETMLGKRRPKNISFTDAKEKFLEAAKQKNKPRTVKDYERLLGRHFKFGRTNLTDIHTRDIIGKLTKLKGTPSEQNHAFVAARVFFRWAKRQGYLETNPLADMTMPAKSSARERVLSVDELKNVYCAARVHPYPYGPIVALLTLTGQRRGEIVALEWGWIDQKARTITLPSSVTKNGNAHTFPYGDAVAALLKDIPTTGERLFPASRSHVRGKETTVFNGWGKAKENFDRGLDTVAPYTLHDLRRTFSSTLAALGTPIHVTEKLLNHVSGTVSGVTAVYNRHTYMDEMRMAVEGFQNHIEQTDA